MLQCDPDTENFGNTPCSNHIQLSTILGAVGLQDSHQSGYIGGCFCPSDFKEYYDFQSTDRKQEGFLSCRSHNQ
jgi:hypothetical protein